MQGVGRIINIRAGRKAIDAPEIAAMKQVSIIAVLVTTLMLPAVAQESVPYAYRPPSSGDSYVPALATLMRAVQFGHIKLSYAGKLANWALAGYELAQIQDSLADAARLYKNIPVEKVGMIDQPLVALTAAIKAKDGARFSRAFADLTATCNSCHEAARVGFITIEVPTSSPFSDQSFAPKKK